MTWKAWFATLVLATASLNACKKEGGNKNNQTSQDSTAKDTLAVKPKVEVKKDRYFNDIARFLGGLEPLEGSTIADLDTIAAVKNHRKAFDNSFANKEKVQLKNLRIWAAKAMGDVREKNRNVFYPFSGADFLTINNLYPNAKNYVMFGLEPEGQIPDFKKISIKEHTTSLSNLANTINDLMSVSFFLTKEMAPDMVRTQYKGILPVLLTFIARTGHEVLWIEHVRLNKEGVFDVVEQVEMKKQTPWDSDITGIRITFRKDENAEVQTVTYFSLDAANAGLEKTPQFRMFMDSYGPTSTYIKAASYLMHNANFSNVRETVEDVSDFLVEDDSGIPFRYFNSENWKVTLYGTYNGPIPLFKNRYQKDYFEAYQKNKDKIEPLDFGIGYVYTKGRSNLIKCEKIKPIDRTKAEKNQKDEKTEKPKQEHKPETKKTNK